MAGNPDVFVACPAMEAGFVPVMRAHAQDGSAGRTDAESHVSAQREPNDSWIDILLVRVHNGGWKR